MRLVSGVLQHSRIETKSSSHSVAFFRALPAGLRTFLAVFRMLMLAAFAAAGFTDVGTNAAKAVCLFTSEAHELCSGITDSGTFHIQLDAARHHFHIFFPGARCCAMIADGSTAKTSVNAGLILVIPFHDDVFKWFKPVKPEQ